MAVPWPGIDPVVEHDEPSAVALSERDTVPETSTLKVEEAGLTVTIQSATPIEEPQGLRPAMREFRKLLELPENWDTYGAPRIQLRTLPHVARILVAMGRDRRAPELYPVNHGGVQLEWRSELGDVEFEITPAGAVAVLLEEANAETPIELEASPGTPEIVDLVKAADRLIPTI